MEVTAAFHPCHWSGNGDARGDMNSVPRLLAFQSTLQSLASLSKQNIIQATCISYKHSDNVDYNKAASEHDVSISTHSRIISINITIVPFLYRKS